MERFKNVLKTGEDKAKNFVKITAEDRGKVKEWISKQNGKTSREKLFLKIVNEAIQEVSYDFWIATMEPSVSEDGIFYEKNKKVCTNLSGCLWKTLAKDYSPERGSRLASLYELFIWYAIRIVNGFWTLEYIANDSSSAGNYQNSPDSVKSIEKTGARKCGGYSDGQGNTYKIVTHKGVYKDCGYALVGGEFTNDGHQCPVACVYCYDYPDYFHTKGSGVLVLTK